MASGIYINAKDQLLAANIDLINAPIAACIVDLSVYTPNLENDSSLANIPEAAFVSESLLKGKSLQGGVFRADDTIIENPESGKTVSGVVIFLSADTYEESFLICLIDDSTAFPFDTDGTDITIQWPAGPDGIFKI